MLASWDITYIIKLKDAYPAEPFLGSFCDEGSPRRMGQNQKQFQIHNMPICFICS